MTLMMTPCAPFDHAAINLAREVDISEELQLPARAPCFLVELGQSALRDRARVVHEDVDVAAVARELHCVLGNPEIERVARDFDAARGRDSGLRFFEIGCAAGGKMQIASFLGKQFGDAESDAAGSAGDERGAPLELEIHAFTPL